MNSRLDKIRKSSIIIKSYPKCSDNSNYSHRIGNRIIVRENGRMNKQKKIRYFVTGLLFTVIGLASINLISCGGSDSAPVIYSISPNGTTVTSSTGTPLIASVTIVGANFGTSQGTGSNVLFNNVVTTVTPWTDSTLVATVPSVAAGALSSGTAFSVPVVVSVNGQNSNAYAFTYVGNGS